MTSLALFDFDGTLTSRDTTRYLLAALAMNRCRRLPLALPYLARMVHAGHGEGLQAAKVRAIGIMLAGLSSEQLDKTLARFAAFVRPLVRPEIARPFVECARINRAIVVTASPDFVVKEIFPDLPFLVLGTRFAAKDGRFTGLTDGSACYGAEKVRRVKQYIHEHYSGQATVGECWSDALSDQPMMQMAAVRHWVCSSQAQRDAFMAADPSATFHLVGPL